MKHVPNPISYWVSSIFRLDISSLPLTPMDKPKCDKSRNTCFVDKSRP